MPPRFKAVLFDHDGTLVASEELHFAHWQQVLARYGATLTESLYQQLYAGMPSVDNAHDAVKPDVAVSIGRYGRGFGLCGDSDAHVGQPRFSRRRDSAAHNGGRCEVAVSAVFI